MNQLEQFREQCAELMDEIGVTLQTDDKTNDYWMGVGEMVNAAEIAIRAMPLPEVKQEPAGHLYYIKSWYEGRNVTTFDYCLASDKGIIKTVPVYEIPPDAEALRKENEQLRGLLSSSRDSIDHHLLNNRSARRDCDYDLIVQIDSVLKGSAK